MTFRRRKRAIQFTIFLTLVSVLSAIKLFGCTRPGHVKPKVIVLDEVSIEGRLEPYRIAGLEPSDVDFSNADIEVRVQTRDGAESYVYVVQQVEGVDYIATRVEEEAKGLRLTVLETAPQYAGTIEQGVSIGDYWHEVPDYIRGGEWSVVVTDEGVLRLIGNLAVETNGTDGRVMGWQIHDEAWDSAHEGD